MHRWFRQTYENNLAFTAGVISLGLLGVVLVIAALFVR